MFILKNKKVHLIFLVILLAGILIRLPGLDDVIYATEFDFTNNLYFSDYMGPHTYVHPPLAISLYYISSELFPGSNIAYRIIPLIFWIISSYIIFILARDLFGDKSALFSSFIMAFIYPMVNYSLRIDYIMIQISALMLSSLFLLRYFSKNKNRYLFFTGIAVGLSFWVNYSSLFFVLVISLFILYKKRNIIETITALFKIGLPAILVFALFPLLSFILEPSIFLRTLTLGNKFSIMPNILTIIYLLIFIGPLLVGLNLLPLSKKEYPKYYSFFVIWIGFLIISLIFTKWYAMVDRYIVLVVPPLCLIGGWILSKFKFKKTDVITFIVGCILWFFLIFVLNSYAYHVPIGISQYIKQITALQWNFMLPFTGRTGPMFGISFISTISSLMISFLLVAGSIILRKNIKISKVLFVLFLSVSVAFNLLIIQEYLFPVSNPDYPKISNDIIDYAIKEDLPQPIYGNNYAFVHYFNLKNNRYISLYGEYVNVIGGTDFDFIEDNLLNSGGTAIVVDFPYLDRSGEVWTLLKKNCNLMKTYYSNDREAANLFVCSKNPN